MIHNPIDIEAVRSRAQEGPGLGSDLPNVIMVARLTNKQKAGDLLLNAFAGVAKKVPARLTFVGDGPDLAALRPLASAVETDRWLPRTDSDRRSKRRALSRRNKEPYIAET